MRVMLGDMDLASVRSKSAYVGHGQEGREIT